MSWKLVRRVWDSALDPELKPVAAVLADFGKEDGTSIYPSMERVAWLRGVSVRPVQRHVRQLRGLGVLIPVSQMTGGGRSVCYRLNVAALPQRPRFEPRRRWLQAPSSNQATFLDDVPGKDPDTSVVQTATLVTPDATPVSPDPDTGVTRSVSHSSRKCQVNSSDEERTAASPPYSRPEISYTKVITKIAHKVMDEIGEDSLDLPEIIKVRCAPLHIPDYSKFVGQAIESARFQRLLRREIRDKGQ